MLSEYVDRHGNEISRREVHEMPEDQLSERSGVELRVFPNGDALYEAMGNLMVELIQSRLAAKTTMILPVGPVGQYPVFARKVVERRVDCRNVWTFNMDEFLDRNGRTIPADHPMSFRGEMQRTFVDRIPDDLRMPLAQMHFPRHDNMDEINRAFDEHAPDGVDWCLAGVGPEGHFAFNEDPNFRHVRVSLEEFVEDRTRLVLVNESTVDMDALVASSGDRAAVPPFAVTIGPRDVLRAKRMDVIFFAGAFQRFALRNTLFRRPTVHFPGSLLRLRKLPDGQLVPRPLIVWATKTEVGPIRAQTI